MDAQHAQQALLIDRIEEAVLRGAVSEVEGLFLELLERTTEHFVAEQDLMRRTGYPGYEAHVAEHNRLLERVASLRDGYGEGRAGLTLDLVRSLRPWLLDHIQGMDQALASYLRQRGIEP